MSEKIKVLIVDDSAYNRQTIKGMLEADAQIEVVGVAHDGVDAMAKVMRLKPDIITLDFEMPEMDGFSFLRWLMKKNPLPVIMVSSYSDKKTVFTALELGAADFISKPTRNASVELFRIRDDLIRKVKGIRDLRLDNLGISRSLTPKEKEPVRGRAGRQAPQPRPREIGAVAIGASTGGPAALQVILADLPAHFPAAILISQHMPKGFTGTFAERLNRLSGLTVKEASEDMPVEGGTALVCPGGSHMTLKGRGRDLRVALHPAKNTDRYTPSIDAMMASVAERYGDAVMGVVLTGMGNDGKSGTVEIKGKGGYTIAESEETSVVFGMPQEAIKTGAVDRVLPLGEIAAEIVRVVMNTGDEQWKKIQES
jgi:two-component system chemotaxis response regulator CheB